MTSAVINETPRISVVIPTYNCYQPLESVIESLQHQTLMPIEIIVIDSSENGKTQTIVDVLQGDNIKYEKVDNAYPGKARNIGAELTAGEWIAFLDSKTIPDNDWLYRYWHLILAYSSDVIYGVTRFDAQTTYQKILRAATYGRIGHQTVPGTLINKKIFNDSTGFLEHVRMGEDIEWRERLVKNGFNIYRNDEPVVTYTGLPDNFSSMVKKYLTSAYHTARLNILRNVKDAYLSLLLILSAIILPKWNHLIEGWNANPLFIPHVTKIYLMALVWLFLIYQLVNYIFFRNISQTLFPRTLKLMVLVFITIAVYRWNAVIAGWMEDAVLYIPHITKMYVGGLIATSIFFRGLFLPLHRRVEPEFLFPFRWIKVGLLGLSLDLLKGPGYIVGSVLSFFKLSRHRLNDYSKELIESEI